MSDFKRISEIARVRRGASPRPISDPNFFGGSVGWVRIVDVTKSNRFLRNTEQYLSPLGESRSVRVYKGDLIMSICGTIGKPIMIDMDACIHDGFVQLYDLSEVETNYLYYILQFSEEKFIAKGQPGTQVNLNTDLVGKQLIYVSKVSEQRKIAKILTTVDNLIEKTQTLIDKYQSIKQGMMHDLFTRGVNENGKLRPTSEEAPHLYKESELGWIPKEWDVKALQDVTEKIQDGTHFSPHTSDGEFLYVTSKNIRFGYMDISSCERISKSEHELIYKRCGVKFGDILLTKDGANTGNASINTVLEPFSLLSSVAFIRCNPDLSVPNFVVQYLLSPIGQNRLKDLMSGNAITRLTLTKINDFKILVPATDEQDQIGECLKTFDKKVLNEKEQLSKYTQIKSGLMQDLLAGKVRVKVAEVEEVVS